MKKPDESYGYLLWLDQVRTTGQDLGRIELLQGESRRWVKAGSIYGLACAYTLSHVYVEWMSSLGVYMQEWMPAGGVHSVSECDWHGLPMGD